MIRERERRAGLARRRIRRNRAGRAGVSGGEARLNGLPNVPCEMTKLHGARSPVESVRSRLAAAICVAIDAVREVAHLLARRVQIVEVVDAQRRGRDVVDVCGDEVLAVDLIAEIHLHAARVPVDLVVVVRRAVAAADAAARGAAAIGVGVERVAEDRKYALLPKFF